MRPSPSGSPPRPSLAQALPGDGEGRGKDGKRWPWERVLWLVYLLNLFWQPLRGLVLGVTLLSLLLFLLLYFLGFGLWGRPRLYALGGLLLLGLGTSRFNAGAPVYLIYAAALAGGLEPPSLARGGVFLAALLVPLAYALSPFPWAPAYVFFTLVLAVAVGFLNLYALEAERARARATELAVLRERDRIASELHDLLGQTLSLLALKAELARRLLPQDPEGAAREMDQVAQAARETLAQVRAVVRGYLGGLEAELKAAVRALEAAGVQAAVAGSLPPLPPAREGALALVLREAVTNVIRHAGARRCRIALGLEGGKAFLEVEDDGVGLRGALEGAGLRGMRERLQALGGGLALEEAGGVRLRAWLPLGGEG